MVKPQFEHKLFNSSQQEEKILLCLCSSACSDAVWGHRNRCSSLKWQKINQKKRRNIVCYGTGYWSCIPCHQIKEETVWERAGSRTWRWGGSSGAVSPAPLSSRELQIQLCCNFTQFTEMWWHWNNGQRMNKISLASQLNVFFSPFRVQQLLKPS